MWFSLSVRTVVSGCPSSRCQRYYQGSSSTLLHVIRIRKQSFIPRIITPFSDGPIKKQEQSIVAHLDHYNLDSNRTTVSIRQILLPSKRCFTTTTSGSINIISSISPTEYEEQKQQEEHQHINILDGNSKNRLDIAIVGLPNAGKSQLLNALTQSTVSAVTRKRHTTRNSGIKGVRTIFPTSLPVNNNNNDEDNINDDESSLNKSNNKQDSDDESDKENMNETTNKNNKEPASYNCSIPTQLVFVDTPGFVCTTVAKKEGLDRTLMTSAKGSISYVDYTLIVIDAAKRITSTVQESIIDLIVAALHSHGRKNYDDDDDNENEDDEDFGEDTSGVVWETVVDNFTDDDLSEEYIVKQANNDKNENSMTKQVKDRNGSMKKTRSMFGIVLNKVDLIYPKTDLIDIAMEVGAIAEACISYHYREQMSRNRTSTDTTLTINEDDEANMEEYIHQMMPTFFYVSAKKQDGIDDVVQHLLDLSTPCNEWEIELSSSSTSDLIPNNNNTNLTIEEQIEERIREKLYRCLHKEVPYQIEQQNRLLRVIPASKRPNNDSNTAYSNANATQKPTIVVHQDLIVRTTSHQELVYGGKKKHTLERIRSTAELDLSRFVFSNCPVQLHLHVRLNKSKNNNAISSSNNSRIETIDRTNRATDKRKRTWTIS